MNNINNSVGCLLVQHKMAWVIISFSNQSEKMWEHLFVEVTVNCNYMHYDFVIGPYIFY